MFLGELFGRTVTVSDMGNLIARVAKGNVPDRIDIALLVTNSAFLRLSSSTIVDRDYWACVNVVSGDKTRKYRIRLFSTIEDASGPTTAQKNHEQRWKKEVESIATSLRSQFGVAVDVFDGRNKRVR